MFPSTGTSPIRLDLWGDQIDRLSEFSIADQRSIAEIESITIAPARELTPTTRVRQRAQELMSAEPWGKEQWDRLASGEFYDGMESWLPWLVDEELILADLLASRSLVLLFDPKRLKDRASEIVAEEQDLAQSLASTWKALEPGGRRTFPGLHVPYERALKVVTPMSGQLRIPHQTPTSLPWRPTLGNRGRRPRAPSRSDKRSVSATGSPVARCS